jgi:hypothetical protein
MAKAVVDTVHHLYIRGHKATVNSAYIDTSWGLGTDASLDISNRQTLS